MVNRLRPLLQLASFSAGNRMPEALFYVLNMYFGQLDQTSVKYLLLAAARAINEALEGHVAKANEGDS